MKLLLNNKVFTFIFAGELLSSLGSGLSIAVFGFWLYNLTHSILIVSLSSAILMAGPMIWGGVIRKFVDNVNPVTSMIIVYLIYTISAIIPIFVLDIKGISLIFFALLINGFAITLSNALWPVATSLFIESSQLNKAEGLLGMLYNIRIFIGTFIGGMLFDIVGPYNVFKIESSLYFIGFLLLSYLRFFIANKINMKQDIQDQVVKESFSIKEYIFKNNILRKTLFITILSQLGFSAMIGLWVPFIEQLYNGNDRMIAFTYIAQGLGGLIGSYIIIGKMGENSNLKRVKWKFLAFFVTTLIYTLIPNFYLLLLIIVFEGLVLEWGLLPLQLVWLNIPPKSIRGSVTATKQGWVSAASIISIITSGIMAEFIGLKNVFLGIALIMLITSFYSWKFKGNPVEIGDETMVKEEIGVS